MAWRESALLDKSSIPAAGTTGSTALLYASERDIHEVERRCSTLGWVQKDGLSVPVALACLDITLPSLLPVALERHWQHCSGVPGTSAKCSLFETTGVH